MPRTLELWVSLSQPWERLWKPFTVHFVCDSYTSLKSLSCNFTPSRWGEHAPGHNSEIEYTPVCFYRFLLYSLELFHITLIFKIGLKICCNQWTYNRWSLLSSTSLTQTAEQNTPRISTLWKFEEYIQTIDTLWKLWLIPDLAVSTGSPIKKSKQMTL